MSLGKVNSQLAALLTAAGCRAYSASDARSEAQRAWQNIRPNAGAPEEAAADPFFTFVVAESVGVFMFFARSVEIYVVAGKEQHFRTHFDNLAMIDVEAARRILTRQFRRKAPDLVIDPPDVTAWLNPDEP